MSAEREKEIREIARTNRGFINHALVDVLAELDECRRERDRLQHLIDCADTPLMRDVLAERDTAREFAEVFEAALHKTVARAEAAEDELRHWKDMALEQINRWQLEGEEAST